MGIVLNVLKILIWIVLIPNFISEFGLVPGIILYALVAFTWNFAATVLREYMKGGQAALEEVLYAVISTDFGLPFTIYGGYCSPKYGLDGITRNLQPIDELDCACEEHDRAMLSAGINATSPKEYVQIKNKGDFEFMKRAITSRNNATGIYLIGLEIGFMFRILGRELFGGRR